MQFTSISLSGTMGAETKKRLGVKAKGRKLVGTGESCELVSVHKWPFSAISTSIGGIACAAYSSMPPCNYLISLNFRKICSFLDRKLINALHETADGHELRELPAPYNGILGHENEAVRLQNEDYWEKSVWITI